MAKNRKNYFALTITVAIIIALTSVLFLSNQPNNMARCSHDIWTIDGSGVSNTITSSGSPPTYTMQISLPSISSSNLNDLLYLSFVGDSGVTITQISQTGTSAWTPRADFIYTGTHHLQTYYATRTTTSAITITITLSSTGNCAAVVFGISGANNAQPFDGSYLTGTWYCSANKLEP